jgi:hypothetical protein
MTELFKGMGETGRVVVIHTTVGESIGLGALPRCPFVCGVLLNDSGWSRTWLEGLICDLIRGGSAYLGFWGSRCEEAHDIADVVRDRFPVPGEGDVVMTTWHDSEPLTEFLEFLSFIASPTDGYDFELRQKCVLDIGQAPNHGVVAVIQEWFVS